MKGMSLIASGRNCLLRNEEDRVCGSGSTGFYGFRQSDGQKGGRRRCRLANDGRQIFRIPKLMFSFETSRETVRIRPVSGTV
jgi:hypothetical protein